MTLPDGDELWKLLLVIAIHKVREKAVYHHAAKRDMHRTIGGDEAGRHLELWSNAQDFHDGYLDAGARRNPGAIALREPEDGEAPARGL